MLLTKLTKGHCSLDNCFYREFSHGICLLGAKRHHRDAKLVLNPGHNFIIDEFDHLYYMSITREDRMVEFIKERAGKNGLPAILDGYGKASCAHSFRFSVQMLDKSPRKNWRGINGIDKNHIEPLLLSKKSKVKGRPKDPLMTMLAVEKFNESIHCKMCADEKCIAKK